MWSYILVLQFWYRSSPSPTAYLLMFVTMLPSESRNGAPPPPAEAYLLGIPGNAILIVAICIPVFSTIGRFTYIFLFERNVGKCHPLTRGFLSRKRLVRHLSRSRWIQRKTTKRRHVVCRSVGKNAWTLRLNAWTNVSYKIPVPTLLPSKLAESSTGTEKLAVQLLMSRVCKGFLLYSCGL